LQKSIIVVLYQYIVVDRSLAKVGVEGSNPFARSNDFNDLGDNAFAAQSGVAACVLSSVLIGTPTQKSWKFSV
jgi:hypothetical protein